MKSKISNILLSILLLLIWYGIFFISFLIWLVSDIIHDLSGGILKYIFVLVYVAGFLIPIIFRKKIKGYCRLPLALIVATIISVFINSVIYAGSIIYISDFTRAKWDKYEKLRIYMVDDLEREHQLIGKSEKEIIELLGEPALISDYGAYRYQYYVGSSWIDPYIYDIVFETGIAKYTEVNEH